MKSAPEALDGVPAPVPSQDEPGLASAPPLGTAGLQVVPQGAAEAPVAAGPAVASAGNMDWPGTIQDSGEFLGRIAEVLRAHSEKDGYVGLFTIGVHHSPFMRADRSPQESLDGGFASDVLRAVLATVRNVAAGIPESGRRAVFGAHIERARFNLCVTALPRIVDALTIANALRETFQQHLLVCNTHVRMQGDIGVATYPAANVSGAAEFISNADTASICAARLGDQLPQLYCDSMRRWRTERQELERDLRAAIDRQEFVVHYQPRVLTRTRQIVGMEALVRWNHPKLGLVAPSQFIPAAEETGLITPLGEWVLRETCNQARAWDKAGFPPIRMGVNLSAAQFRDPRLFERTTEILRETGLEADRLELELTESILMRDPKAAIQTLAQLKNAGVHVAIDDFGTGYSSLSYLKRFPVDAMKIDQSFIRQVTNNPEDAAITTAVIVLGHSLKLRVVAEGVETESQLAFLRVLDCNEVQGFLLGHPEPAPKAAELLLSQKLVFGR
jgi:EAL domain-containing protein (putative c-di-GMP-specific phosphodiesterase class I)